jgi:tetratricopeptide (TPR) repeat protein
MKTLLIGGTKQMLMLLMFVLTAFMLVTSGLRGEEVLPGREDARTCDTKSGQEGIDGCTRLIKLYPKFPLAYYNRGLHHSRNGELDLALADYTTAIELEPKEKSFYINRGAAYHKKRDYDKAIADYTAAIKIDPALRNAYLNRGLSHTSKGDAYHSQKNFTQARVEYDLASDDLVKASKLSPDDGRAQNALSINEEARRKNDRALEGSLGGR